MSIFSVNEIVLTSPQVPELFLSLFSGERGEGPEGVAKEAWFDLKLDVLHMMGALFSSSKVRIQYSVFSSNSWMCMSRATVS